MKRIHKLWSDEQVSGPLVVHVLLEVEDEHVAVLGVLVRIVSAERQWLLGPLSKSYAGDRLSAGPTLMHRCQQLLSFAKVFPSSSGILPVRMRVIAAWQRKREVVVVTRLRTGNTIDLNCFISR